MCPFTECYLRDANDCAATSSSWSGSSRIDLDENWPDIELEMENYNFGYSYDICMRCTNGQVFSDVVSFSVTVGAHPCAQVLSDVSGADDHSFPF